MYARVAKSKSAAMASLRGEARAQARPLVPRKHGQLKYDSSGEFSVLACMPPAGAVGNSKSYSCSRPLTG